jgi:hypothetical protein
MNRQVRVYKQDLRRRYQHRDGFQILQRVVLRAFVEDRVDADGARIAQKQGVAVWPRLNNELRTDAAIGAATVVDDDRLPPHLREAPSSNLRAARALIAAFNGIWKNSRLLAERY